MNVRNSSAGYGYNAGFANVGSVEEMPVARLFRS